MHALYDGVAVFQRAHIDEIAGQQHRLQILAFSTQRSQTRYVFLVAYHPGTVTPDTNDARSHDLFGVARKIDLALDKVSLLVFRLDDSREREAVLLALDGHGKPAGVRSCEERAGEIVVSLDETITPPALVRHLVEIESSRVSRSTGLHVRDLDDDGLARLVAEATLDPELDAHRIIEHLVPELGTL